MLLIRRISGIIFLFALFFYLYPSNLYALNFDYKNNIFSLDIKTQDGSALSSAGEIIHQNKNKIILNIYDAVEEFELIYDTNNLSKPWSSNTDFQFQGLSAADLFNYLYVFDYGLKNIDVSKSYYPKSFLNRKLSTSLKLLPDFNNEPAMKKILEEMLFILKSSLKYKGQECFEGRESYVFNQNSSRSFNINYLNIDYPVFIKFNNSFYVDIETGLISAKEDGSFRIAGQNEKFINLLNFNFLKNNCGNQINQINTKVKNAYINAKSNNYSMSNLINI